MAQNRTQFAKKARGLAAPRPAFIHRCGLALTLISAACISMGGNAQGKPMNPKYQCLAAHCGWQVAACEFEAGCRGTLGCVRGCAAQDGEQGQACMISCVETGATPKYDQLTACMAEHRCFPAPVAKACQAPANLSELAPMPLKALAGTWYVLRGLSRAYDCWPCQKMMFSELAASSARYDYEYRIGEHVSRIQCQVAADGRGTASGQMRVSYRVHGMVGADDWYVLSQPRPDFALIYYCGTNPADRYRGAVVIGRQAQAELPAAVVEDFRRALRAAGLALPVDLADFCVNDYRGCVLN